MRKSKGITLIALIVTIIVLLILAGVAIATLTGENGLLTKASEAQKKTDKASDQERIEVEVLGSYGKDGKLDLSSLKDNITKNMSGATIEGDNFPIKVNLEKNSYVVTADGKVTIYTSRDGIKIGDYIDYTPSTAEAYPVEKLGDGYTGSTKNTTPLKQEKLNWRILRIYEDGSMDLMSEPTSATVNFQGARGYNNGVYVLNDICEKLYSNKNKRITARSVNLEDMEKWLTEEGKKAKNDYISKHIGELSINNYIERVDKANNTVTYKTNNYYPVLWKVQSNESESYYTEKTLIKEDELNKSYEYKAENLTVEQTYYYIGINEQNYGDGYKVLYYRGESTDQYHYYWVASRLTLPYNDFNATFGLRSAGSMMGGYGMFNSNKSNVEYLYSLRAIVSLNSDIKISPVEGASENPENAHHIEW